MKVTASAIPLNINDPSAWVPSPSATTPERRLRADGLLVVSDVDAESATFLDRGIEMKTPIETGEWGERPAGEA